MGDPKPKRQDSMLGGPETESLGHAVAIIEEAFGAPCLLVGSATERTDYRDVDVRMMLPPAAYDALFGKVQLRARYSPLWTLLHVAISEYLRKRTGLPVDFQIQRDSPSVRERYKDSKAVELRLSAPEWYPEWRPKT